MMSKRKFLALGPRLRGYAVYMLGARKDQPNVPNEPNPYPRGSRKHHEWDEGQRRAMLDTIDGEE